MKYGVECSFIVRFEVEHDTKEELQAYLGALEGYNTGSDGQIPDDFKLQSVAVYDSWEIEEDAEGYQSTVCEGCDLG